MIFKFVSLLGLLSSCIYALESSDGKVVLNDKPGRLYMWSNAASALENHITKSVDIKHAADTLSEQANKHEVIVLISPDAEATTSTSNCMQKNGMMKDFYSTAKNQQTLYYVYATQESSALDTTVHRTLTASANSVKKVASLHDLSSSLHENPKVLFDGKKDIFEVPASAFHGDKDTLQALSSKPILFVTYDNVVADKTKRMTRQLGEYAVNTVKKGSAKVMSTSTSTTDSTSKYYSPEGGEYSIYYADTYLYITPDIFTGLMSGIFMFFVALIGLNCLGGIQGNTSYVEKLPIVGREA